MLREAPDRCGPEHIASLKRLTLHPLRFMKPLADPTGLIPIHVGRLGVRAAWREERACGLGLQWRIRLSAAVYVHAAQPVAPRIGSEHACPAMALVRHHLPASVYPPANVATMQYQRQCLYIHAGTKALRATRGRKVAIDFLPQLHRSAELAKQCQPAMHGQNLFRRPKPSSQA